MLRLLQSIFGVRDVKKGEYPEWLIRKAVERAVDGTDPLLRLASGYKRKLRPAVIQAIDYVIGLVDILPPATPVNLERRGDDPLLKALFVSVDEMRKVFRGDRNLAGFLRTEKAALETVTALLVMEKNEKVIYGAEMSGDTVLRDMPKKIVSFDGHILIDPAGSEDETRLLLKKRAYDHLVSLALRRITMLKAERDELERRHTLLQSKLRLLRRGGWGFEEGGATADADIPVLEEQVGRIEDQLLKMGGDDRLIELYLGIVSEVLGRPGEHLWGGKETIILDGMGIRRDRDASNVNELTFHELFNSEGRNLVALLVVVDGGEIRSICG